eukprot:c25727_g1_i1 orf=436-1713(-)
MAMESPLRSFIESEVPEWNDDVVGRTLVKAFSGQRTDWEGRFQFWKELVIKVARHLRLIVIDTDIVKNKWFLRGGLTPLCLDQVLVEMYNCGDLQKIDELTTPVVKFKWLSDQIRSVVSWTSQKLIGIQHVDTNGIERRLIITMLLQERFAEVRRSLADSTWSSSCVTTVAQFRKLSGGEEEAYILQNHLLRIGKAKQFFMDEDSQIEGLKISLNSDQVSDVTKLDHYMLHLRWTMEKLQLYLDTLNKQAVQLKKCALTALQCGEKETAKRHLLSLKSLSASKLKCENFQLRIEEVLSLISEAELSKKVSESIQLGAHAIKEHEVTLEDVQLCLKELDEAILIQKMTENALGSFNATNGNEDGDEEYDQELAQLEMDDLSIQDQPSNFDAKDQMSGSVAVEPVAHLHDLAIQEEHGHLNLECEPA